MFNGLRRLLTVVLTISLSGTVSATTDSSYRELEQAYYHRHYQLLARKIQELPSKDVRVEILEVALAVATEQENKEAQLEALIKRHSNSAQVRYFAGKLWYQIKEQSSLLNKLGLVDKSNDNFIVAAKLEPDNPQYLVEAAKAIAVTSGFWGSGKEESKAIIDKLANLDKRHYHLALMDYLQNTQNKGQAIKTVVTVQTEYKNDVELMNRAANLLWTFSEKDQSQQLFVESCNIKSMTMEQFPIWQEACMSSAYLALQGHGDKKNAIKALARLLSVDQVKDEQYVDYLTVYAQLNSEIAEIPTAVTSYQQALKITGDHSTRNNINKELKKLTK